MFCLPKHLVDLFLGKLKAGEIDPAKLSEMTSAERNSFFTSFLGDKNATKVNALFESKLLLKNQQQGMINWAKQVSGLKPQVQRDLISKVEKMTEILQPKDLNSFLGDLASQKLGIGVTMEEAGKIADLAKTVSDKKGLIKETSPIGSSDRMDYGTALTVFKDYVGGLKSEAKKLTPKELLTKPAELIEQIGGVTKSIAASMDNSFFGRQGFITLVNEPDIWGNNFIKSWGNMAKEIKGIDSMLPVKADVFSRPNAINGKYKTLGIDIGLDTEEAFPSQLPEKIPLLGRLFKASESSYNAAGLRFRADLADRFIEEAESMGVVLKDSGIGDLINSMTGRGKVKLTPEQAKFINTTIFSIKYFKSNIDVLTAHAFDPKMGKFAKKKASENLVKLIATIASTLAIAKMFDPKSVEEDPRSSDFGKIMVGKNHEIKVNIALGLNSIITLASRITPTLHNGKWGFWTKNSKGQYKQLGTGKFGVAEPSELIADFIKGKAAPITRLLLTMWEGKTFEGQKPTILGETGKLVTPIPAGNFFELAKTSAGADPLLYAMMSALDLLGVNVSTKQRRK